MRIQLSTGLLLLIICMLHACTSPSITQAERVEILDTSLANQRIFVRNVGSLFGDLVVHPRNQALNTLYTGRFDSLMARMNHRRIINWRGRITNIHFDTARSLSFIVKCKDGSEKNTEGYVTVNLIIGSSEHNPQNGYVSSLDNEVAKFAHKKQSTPTVIKRSANLVTSNKPYYNTILNLSEGEWIEISGTIEDVATKLYWQTVGSGRTITSYPVQNIDLLFAIDSLKRLDITEIMADSTLLN